MPCSRPPPVAECGPEHVFRPGIDVGLALLLPEDFRPRWRPPASISGMALSSNIEHRLKIAGRLAELDARAWPHVAEFPTIIALADGVGMTDGHLTVGGKYLLSGAGGVRFRNHFGADAPVRDGDAPDAQLEVFLRPAPPARIPVTPLAPIDLPLVLEVKNFGNFYHVVKETFGQLCLVSRYGLTGPIILATAARAPAQKFVTDLIQTWFPDLAPRITLVTRAGDFGQALVALDTSHLRYLSPDLIPPTEGEPEGFRSASRRMLHTVAAQSVEEPVAALRHHVHTRIGPQTRRRRIVVQRKSRRERAVHNEARLLDRLAPLGFETLCFEDLTVEQQATAMAQADCVVALHGAGVANMLFVREGCLVVELSNLQTLLARFGDFSPLAHAAGARYLHAFVDHDFPDPDVLPNYRDHGLRGVSMSDFAVDVIAARIHAELEPAAAAAALDACRAANDAGTGAADVVDRHRSLVWHVADVHVWLANAAPDRAAALPHLRRALHLAPGRVPLLKRTMTAARAVGDRDLYLEAAASFLAMAPRRAQAFLSEKGWSVEDSLAERT